MLLVVSALTVLSCTSKPDGREHAGSDAAYVPPRSPKEVEATVPRGDPLPAVRERAVQAPGRELTQLTENTIYDELRLFAGYVHERIAAQDFYTWKELLTDAYIAHYDDNEYLAQLSQRQVLRNQGVTLRTLRDYFDYVVVESRTDTAVDAVEVLDTDQALAYTEIEGERVVLMLAVVENGRWKIDRY